MPSGSKQPGPDISEKLPGVQHHQDQGAVLWEQTETRLTTTTSFPTPQYRRPAGRTSMDGEIDTSLSFSQNTRPRVQESPAAPPPAEEAKVF